MRPIHSMAFTAWLPQTANLAPLTDAQVRLAAVMALPVDEEIEASGAKDAGDYLISFEACSPKEFAKFVDLSRGHWSKEPRQVVSRGQPSVSTSQRDVGRT